MSLETGKQFVEYLFKSDEELEHADQDVSFQEAPLEYVYEGVKYVKDKSESDIGANIFGYVNRILGKKISFKFVKRKNFWGKPTIRLSSIFGPYPLYENTKRINKLKRFSTKKTMNNVTRNFK